MVFKSRNYQFLILLCIISLSFSFQSEDINNFTNSQHSTLNIIKSSGSKLDSFYFENENSFFSKSDRTLNNNIDIHKLYEDKLLLTKEEKNSYDIANRFILEHEYKFNNSDSISHYEFMYSKSIAKYDNGFFSNILIISSINDTLFFSDLYSNTLFSYKMNYSIGDIITFKTIDETDFYLLNKDRNQIQKFSIQLHKYINETSNNGDKITIRTFQEINGKKENMIYDLYYNYNKTLSQIKFEINEREIFNLKENETILNINPVITKGTKTLNIFTSKHIAYRLKNDDLSIKSVEKFNIPKEDKDILFFNNYISYKTNETSMGIFHLSNSTSPLSQCEIEENSEIESFYFDSTMHLLFILFSNGKIYYTFSNSYVHQSKQCKVNYLTNINIKSTKGFYIKMMRRDLIISNKADTLEFLNFEDIEWGNSDTFNKVKRQTIHMDEISIENEAEPKLIKTSLEHFLMMKNSNSNKILLYHIPNINSKIKGSEEVGFNFKIPIIFIALIIIFIVNYYKKKKSVKEEDSEFLKKQVLDELKRYGGVKKKYKEQ